MEGGFRTVDRRFQFMEETMEGGFRMLEENIQAVEERIDEAVEEFKQGNEFRFRAIEKWIPA